MKKVIASIALLALLTGISVEAGPGPSPTMLTLSEQGYGIGLELGCSESFWMENYTLFINTVDWADQAGIPEYGEGVAVGYFNSRAGAPNRSFYCPGGTGGGSGGGGGTGGGGGEEPEG